MYTTPDWQATVEGSIKALQRYIPANIQPEHVEMLCPVADHEGVIVWSTFDPEDWSIVTEEMAGRVLGIRQKFEEGMGGSDAFTDVEDTLFTIGQVGVAYGVFKKGTTTWSMVNISQQSISPSINRPKSYQVLKFNIQSIFQF